MAFRFNPFTGNLDLVNSTPTTSTIFDFHMASLSAFDKVVEIDYLDLGLKTQRIDTVTLSSTIYPEINIVKQVNWLDVGTMNQRIANIEYSGPIFGSDIIRKVYQYTASDIRYINDGFYFELV